MTVRSVGDSGHKPQKARSKGPVGGMSQVAARQWQSCIMQSLESLDKQQIIRHTEHPKTREPKMRELKRYISELLSRSESDKWKWKRVEIWRHMNCRVRRRRSPRFTPFTFRHKSICRWNETSVPCNSEPWSSIWLCLLQKMGASYQIRYITCLHSIANTYFKLVSSCLEEITDFSDILGLNRHAYRHYCPREGH